MSNGDTHYGASMFDDEEEGGVSVYSSFSDDDHEEELTVSEDAEKKSSAPWFRRASADRAEKNKEKERTKKSKKSSVPKPSFSFAFGFSDDNGVDNEDDVEESPSLISEFLKKKGARDICGVILALLFVVLVVSVNSNDQALVTHAINSTFHTCFGLGAYVIVFVPLIISVQVFTEERYKLSNRAWFGGCVLFFSALTGLALCTPGVSDSVDPMFVAENLTKFGGLVGSFAGAFLYSLFGRILSMVFVVAFGAIGAVILGVSIGPLVLKTMDSISHALDQRGKKDEGPLDDSEFGSAEEENDAWEADDFSIEATDSEGESMEGLGYLGDREKHQVSSLDSGHFPELSSTSDSGSPDTTLFCGDTALRGAASGETTVMKKASPRDKLASAAAAARGVAARFGSLFTRLKKDAPVAEGAAADADETAVLGNGASADSAPTEAISFPEVEQTKAFSAYESILSDHEDEDAMASGHTVAFSSLVASRRSASADAQPTTVLGATSVAASHDDASCSSVIDNPLVPGSIAADEMVLPDFLRKEDDRDSAESANIDRSPSHVLFGSYEDDFGPASDDAHGQPEDAEPEDLPVDEEYEEYEEDENDEVPFTDEPDVAQGVEERASEAGGHLWDDVDEEPASLSQPSARREPDDSDAADAPGVPAHLPSPTLLSTLTDRQSHKVSDEQLEHTREKLERTLETFGLHSKVVGWIPGPTVTTFKVQPGEGERVNRIMNLEDDIALSLKAESVRIFSPIPGTSNVGIEAPNPVRQSVLFSDILPSVQGGPLEFALGKDSEGEPVVADLAAMPHLLIAGTTGSGKSVVINSILMTFLMRDQPEDIRLIMIDPKRVEFAPYDGLPHLYVPVVTEPKQAASALQWAVSEMDRRLKIFERVGVRKIDTYHEKLKAGEFDHYDNPPQQIPYLVIVIDELADLMMVAGKDVESSIVRIAQLGRAAGIHMIVATQRPSSNVVTGLIKSNITNRIALTVATGVDSRVILDQNGAEKLLGRGDMLFSRVDWGRPRRIQGCFVSDEEIFRVVADVKEHNETDYHEEILSAVEPAQMTRSSASSFDPTDDDPLLWDAAHIVVESCLGSTSNLQRRLKLGYARAGRIMDMLEEKGVVGPPDGSKPREVLLDAEGLMELEEVEKKMVQEKLIGDL